MLDARTARLGHSCEDDIAVARRNRPKHQDFACGFRRLSQNATVPTTRFRKAQGHIWHRFTRNRCWSPTEPAANESRRSRGNGGGQYKDAHGRLKRVPLTIDKMAAQTMLNKLVRKVERERAGLIDPVEEHQKRPLLTHLVEFTGYLTNKGVSARRVFETTRKLERAIGDRKWKLLRDIDAVSALEFLGQLRRRDGLSAQTYNHYLTTLKQFTRWLARERRISFDPLAHLSRVNVQTDRRHDRRALSADEFSRLIDAARSGASIEGISGPDRAMMYILASWTGFRKGEIGSLTVGSFRLDDEPPTATVDACYSKRKRRDIQVAASRVGETVARLDRSQTGEGGSTAVSCLRSRVGRR